MDWLEYENWSCTADPRLRGVASAVSDNDSFNQGETHRPLNHVSDVFLSCRLQTFGTGRFALAATDGGQRFEVEFEPRKQSVLRFGGQVILTQPLKQAFSRNPVMIEFGLFDQQVILAIDGRTVLRHEYERRGSDSSPTLHPLSIGTASIGLEVNDLRIWRDIFFLDPQGLPRALVSTGSPRSRPVHRAGRQSTRFDRQPALGVTGYRAQRHPGACLSAVLDGTIAACVPDPSDDSAWEDAQSPVEPAPRHDLPEPRLVRAAAQRGSRSAAAWQDVIDSQPMDFFVRQLEPAWRAARDRLAAFVGAASGNLIFVENATVGMNIVADSFPLAAGDEVLLTDHEYGAVQRIWQRACEKAGAACESSSCRCRFDHGCENCGRDLRSGRPTERG